jgi:cytochrome b
MVKVWDPLVRLGHWALVAGVAIAWFTREGARTVHEQIGYAVLAVVVLRVLWGFTGPRYARFAPFVRSPSTTLAYARAVFAGSESRHLGHNPLGGWMTVVLLGMIALVALSGWLYTTDAFWGVQWVAEVHEALSDGLLGLIALHIAGVVFTSYRHRENLVAAMVHGRKRPG